MAKIGLIGGSGLYNIKGLVIKKRKNIITPFGKPSDEYVIGQIGNTGVVFLPRHGSRHNLAPHRINFRANIWGFKTLGVERIISVSAVGGIRKGLKPGSIAVLDQIIDMTGNRESTFFDGKSGSPRSRRRVVHIDFTMPYCGEMRGVLLKSGQLAKIPLKASATYAAVEGPRLESAAEIKALRIMGADVVGMTGMPEAALARELEICYSGISVVANYAAGITKKKLTAKEVIEEMKASTDRIKKILKYSFNLFTEQRKCACTEALKDAVM